MAECYFSPNLAVKSLAIAKKADLQPLTKRAAALVLAQRQYREQQRVLQEQREIMACSFTPSRKSPPRSSRRKSATNRGTLGTSIGFPLGTGRSSSALSDHIQYDPPTYPPTPSTHPINSPYQPTPSIHPINNLHYQHPGRMNEEPSSSSSLSRGDHPPSPYRPGTLEYYEYMLQKKVSNSTKDMLQKKVSNSLLIYKVIT